jgi:cytochrome c oxidase assembly factor CtaG
MAGWGLGSPEGWGPLAALVLLAALALWARRWVRPLPWARVSWWAGVAALAAAWSPPLFAGALTSLSLAMVQRMLVTTVAAPLMLYPLDGGRLAAWVGRCPPVRATLRQAWWPLLVFNGAFAVAAVPSLWDWVSGGPGPLAGANLVFFVLGLWFWWPVVTPSPVARRLHPGFAMVYLFLAELLTTPLFIYWTLLSTHAIYQVDAAGVAGVGLTPLGDERLAGLVVKAGSLLPFGTAFVLAFAEWWRGGRPGADDARAVRPPVDLAAERLRRRGDRRETSEPRG